MFCDRFEKLCEDRGIKPTTAGLEIGLSKGTISYWKRRRNQGFEVKPDSYTTEKIADYFGVSVDYLLERTDDPVDYEDGDLIASLNPTVLSHFDGDVKKALDYQKALDDDVANQNQNDLSALISKYKKLDHTDMIKVDAYIDGLLSADKYHTTPRAKDA